MIYREPCFFVFFVFSDMYNPCWFTFCFVSCIIFETEIRCPVFIYNELIVFPGGIGFISKCGSNFRKVLDQVFKFSGIVSIPRCHSKPVYDAGIDIYADMEFYAVLPFVSSFDSDVVPGAAVASSKTCTVNSDIHTMSSEKTCYPVHHFSDIFDREFFHPSMDNAMSG